jgi:HD superfamily phosphodiesterase
MIKTAEGKKMAAERHEYMKSFVDRFEKEWKGSA